VIVPLLDNVVLERLDEAEVSSGGVYIPDQARTKSQRGLVLAVGPGLYLDNGKRIPIDVEVGNVVVFSKYAGSDVTLDGEDYLIISISDIFCIVHPED